MVAVPLPNAPVTFWGASGVVMELSALADPASAKEPEITKMIASHSPAPRRTNGDNQGCRRLPL
jgi:hypothetical protein